MTARYVIGDVFERLAEIPDDSIDLVLTSPPFLALRSYLPADHPDKAKEIGSEPDPAAFLQTLLALTAEWDRVLAPHGSIAVELGDTYSGSGGAGGDYGAEGLREAQPKFVGSAVKGRRNRPADVAAGILAPTRRPGPEGRDSIDGWPLAKSLCMIPQLYAASLAYGRNLLGGSNPVEFEPWRVRNIVRWCRPNPPVGALGDKFRPGTSEMTIACKSRTRYFDLDAVRLPFTGHTYTEGSERQSPDEDATGRNWSQGLQERRATHSGAPPLDWWSIPTQPYSGSHYATFPEALCVKPIEAMVPRRVCTVCGEPSRRIAVTANAIGEAAGRRSWRNDTEGKHTGDITRSISSAPTAERETTGWSECDCPGGESRWRRGIVLDPFAGSGTTLKVAVGLGRDAIGIDLDERNADLARERCGMFLDVDSGPAVVDVKAL